MRAALAVFLVRRTAPDLNGAVWARQSSCWWQCNSDSEDHAPWGSRRISFRGVLFAVKLNPRRYTPPSVPIDQVGDYNYATWHELPENHGYWRYMNNGIGNQDRPTVIHAGSLPKAEVTYFFVVPRIKIEPPTIEPTRSESR